MYSALKNQLKQYIKVSDEEIEPFCQLFEAKEVKKKEFLLREGEICQYETFIYQGLFKVFHLDRQSEEHILYFGAENWWVMDFDSFDNEIPSRLNIQALEDSQVLIISKENKEKAYREMPFLHELIHKAMKKTHIALQRRMLDNISKTATQRYWEYLEKYPNIAKRLSNMQMASYLGISHEFVSKIRRKGIEK